MATISKSTSLDALRDSVRAALQTKYPSKIGGSYVDGPYIRDLFMTQVVFEYNGGLFSASYTNTKGVIAFSDPTKVEVAYKPLKESVQGVVLGREKSDVLMLEAGAYNKASKELTITVIKPGFNTSKSRYYPKATLARDHKVFDNAKMFTNHQTQEEAKKRPEGSVHDWAASMGPTFVDSATGAIKAKAKIVDPPFQQKLELLDEHGLLPQMGVSIRAWGGQQEAEVEGTKTNWVESFKGCKSVDFVTFPGAGGGVDGFAEAMDGIAIFDDVLAFQESQTAEDIDVISLDVLYSRRPDLVRQIQEAETERIQAAMTEAEMKEAIEKANKERDEAKTALAEAHKATAKLTAATALNTMLAEAKLPEVAEKRLRSQFAEADNTTGFADAIKGEKEYLEAVGYKAPAATTTKGRVLNMGGQVTETGTKAEATIAEADQDEALVKEFMRSMKITEAAAREQVANL